MCRRRFCSACPATSTGGQRNGAAIHVAFTRPKGRRRRGNNKVDSSETAAPPQDGNCRRAHERGDRPTAALGWAVSRMFVFPPPCGQFRRTNDRAGPANVCAHPISPPSLASSRRGSSIPEHRDQSSVRPDGAAAQSYREQWYAGRQNEKVKRGNFAGRGPETAPRSSVPSSRASFPAGRPSLPGS